MHAGLVWLQHRNDQPNVGGDGPDHISALGYGFHVGGDVIFKNGFYIAGVAGYPFPGASTTWQGSVRSPYLSSERIDLRYTDNINIDMALGFG